MADIGHAQSIKLPLLAQGLWVRALSVSVQGGMPVYIFDMKEGGAGGKSGYHKTSGTVGRKRTH